MRGLMLAEDFDWLAAEVGLTVHETECQCLRAFLVDGLPLETLARSADLSPGEVQQVLMRAAERLSAHDWPTSAEQAYRELLAVMRGPRPNAPAAPQIGFVPDHPHTAEYAQAVATRATILTAEDLAFGEKRWRAVSPVEAAQQGKALRRQARKGQADDAE